jgi:hypothetical protein
MLALAAGCLALACGSSTSSAPPPAPVAPPINVPTTALTDLDPAATQSYAVSGTDSTGTAWSGTYVVSVPGPTSVTPPGGTATAVVEKDVAVNITSTGTTPLTYTSLTQQYFESASNFTSLVLWKFTAGTTVTMGYPVTLEADLPAVVSTGSSGNWWSFPLNASTTLTGSWEVTNPGTGNLLFQLTSEENGSPIRQDNWVLNPTGTILSGQVTLYSFPATGQSLVLNATPQ